MFALDLGIYKTSTKLFSPQSSSWLTFLNTNKITMPYTGCLKKEEGKKKYGVENDNILRMVQYINVIFWNIVYIHLRRLSRCAQSINLIMWKVTYVMGWLCKWVAWLCVGLSTTRDFGSVSFRFTGHFFMTLKNVQIYSDQHFVGCIS